MSLLNLWKTDPEQVREKKLHQLIAFAGEGKLLDGSAAAKEFREFLAAVPSELLDKYASECLDKSFTDSGLALQDITNEIGRRLGFRVEHGRYRGKRGESGADGLWIAPEGNRIVVEVKTTDTYRIDLKVVAGYRRQMIRDGHGEEESSSILFAVGREDTGDLEAQIRGSRHAWDIRVISVTSLLKLLEVKEDLEGPWNESRIRTVLIPREYTRVDEIIDLVFSATEDVKQEQLGSESDEEEDGSAGAKSRPVRFHEACAKRVADHLGVNLVRRSRATFSSPDGDLTVLCAVSKEHGTKESGGYWFAFHPHQKDRLEASDIAYVAFGCGSPERIVLFPLPDFVALLDGFHQTHLEDGRSYWHVRLHHEDGKMHISRKKGIPNMSVSQYVLTAGNSHD